VNKDENETALVLDALSLLLFFIYLIPITGYFILSVQMPKLVKKVDPDNYRIFRKKYYL